MTDQGNDQNFKRRHPLSPFQPGTTKYPYNRVTVTESGHEFHWDDTPGHERIRMAHKSGSYTEWSPQGNVVQMIVGWHAQYMKKGHTLTVDGNYDEKFNGATRHNHGGNRHTEIHGSDTSSIEGDHKSIVGGDHVSSIKGDHVHGVGGHMVAKFGGGMTLKFDGTAQGNSGASANVDFKSDAPMNVATSKSLQLFSQQAMNIVSEQSITLSVGTTQIIIGNDGTINIVAPSGIFLVGPSYVGVSSQGQKTSDLINQGPPASQAWVMP